MKKERHVRRIPPHCSKKELLEQTSAELERCGVEMQTQAQFTYEIGKQVIGSRDARFFSLQPELKIRSEEAWNRAYVLVFKYLQKYDMKTTLATIEREFLGKAIPKDTKFLRRQSPIDHMSNLLESYKASSFQHRVAKFAGIPIESQAQPSVQSVAPKMKSPKVLTPSGNRLKEMIETSKQGTAQRKQSTSTPKRTHRK